MAVGAELDARVRTGVRYMYILRAVALLVAILSNAVLSRLLAPEVFGIMAMAGYVLTFFATFRDYGVTAATVQLTAISQAELSALFWVNGGVTILLAGIAAASSPLVAQFYSEPIIIPVLLSLCFIFAITGMSAQHSTILSRNLCFREILLAQGCGMLVGLAVGVAGALVWRDVWALVAMNVAQAAANAIMLVMFSRWVPSSPRHMLNHLAAVKFGLSAVLYSVCNFLSNNLTGILIGRLFGAFYVGQYSRAWQMYTLPRGVLIDPTLSVMFPFWCRIKDQDDRLRESYLLILRRFSVFLIPAGVALPFVSDDVVRIFLGPGWNEAALILTCLAPNLLFLGFVVPFGHIMLALGRTKELRLWGVGELVIRGGGAVLGSLHSAAGAALGWSLASLLVATPIIMLLLHRRTPINLRSQMNALVAVFLVAGTTLAGGLLALWIEHYFMIQSPSWVLVVRLLGLAAGWGAAVTSQQSTRAMFKELANARRPGVVPAE